MIVAGCMSGTSLDGIDVALVEIHPRGDSYRIAMRQFVTVPFSDDLRASVAAMLPPEQGSTESVAALHAALGDAFGEAVRSVASGEHIDAIASHGLTVWHDSERRFTLQLGDAFRIRERGAATVIYDFRSGDTAAGGQGAPLVPYVDALMLASRDKDRVAVNIGGIANLTILRAGAAVSDAIAFDSGPGNMLIDAFIAQRTAGRERYDRDGACASRGRVDRATLAAMRDDPYFATAPPKSTGRERFGAAFLDRFGERFDRLSLDDGCATLAALTATTLADAIRAHAPEARTIVSGGGAHNRALVAMLSDALSAPVETSDRYGLPVDAKEAIAFAVLGYETLRERAAGLPRVTGARYGAVLGAIAPHDLRTLLDRIEEEVRSSVKDEA